MDVSAGTKCCLLTLDTTSPALETQDALAAMFQMLQRLGSSLATRRHAAPALQAAAEAGVAALACSRLPKEASGSGAIVLWAAWALPCVDQQQAAHELAGTFSLASEAAVSQPVARSNGAVRCGGSIVQREWAEQVGGHLCVDLAMPIINVNARGKMINVPSVFRPRGRVSKGFPSREAGH